MGYSVDLHHINLAQYEEKLKRKTLIPSQQILVERIGERFDALRAAGISDAAQLDHRLKDKGRLQGLAEQAGIDPEYLSVLGRELRSRRAKPRKLRDFTWFPAEVIEKFEADGIKNTKQLYDLVRTPEARRELVDRFDLDEPVVLALTKQTDLTRIQWVSATFARVLYETGHDTPDQVRQADAETLYAEIREVNDTQEIYKGNLGLNDIRTLVEVAQEVEPDVRY